MNKKTVYNRIAASLNQPKILTAHEFLMADTTDQDWTLTFTHIRHIAYILEAYERTDEGLEWVEANNIRAYTLSNIISLSQEEMGAYSRIMTTIDAIKREFKDIEIFKKLSI